MVAHEVLGGVKELGHIVLYVSDIQRSTDFYSEVLGWPVVFPPSPNAPIAVFTGGNTHHELLLIEVGPSARPVPPAPRLGLYHFGLKVGDSDDELRAALQRLVDADVPIVGATDHTVTHSVYITDPDGNEIELYIDVPGMDWRSEPELLLSRPRPLAL